MSDNNEYRILPGNIPLAVQSEIQDLALITRALSYQWMPIFQALIWSDDGMSLSLNANDITPADMAAVSASLLALESVNAKLDAAVFGRAVGS